MTITADLEAAVAGLPGADLRACGVAAVSLANFPIEDFREARRRWPHSGLQYRRAWWMRRLLNADSGYTVYRAGKYVGMVLRYGRTWFAAAPDPEGKYLLTRAGDFLRFRDRDTATLGLAMYAEGMLP